MAALFLLFLGVLLSCLQSSGTQTIIGLSPSFDHQDPPRNPSPDPTKQSVLLWPSLPPRGRSDVPIRPTVKGKLTNTWHQGQRRPHPTAQSPPSFITALSTHNLSSGPLITQPPSSRARTDTARLAFRGHLTKVDPASKCSTPPQPTTFRSAVTENPEEEPVGGAADEVLQDLGSGNIPAEDESPVPLPGVGDEMAQYQPPAQTTSMVSDRNPPGGNHTSRPHLFLLTPANDISRTPSTRVRATAPTVAALTTPHTANLSGNLNPPTPRKPNNNQYC